MTKRVLLVEDDEDLRELLRSALEQDGFTVVSAENGVEALVQLEFGPAPSVILLNLVMPVMPGAELLDAIRRDPAMARIPVVLITGAPVPVEVGRAADGVLSKPFDTQQLSEIVHFVTRGEPPAPTPPPALA